MDADLVHPEQLWPLMFYFAAVLLIVGGMLAIPRFLAPSRREPATNEPFESGIVSVGSTHLRLAVHFYPIAIFFVIFDLEAIFIFAWAVAFREAGWLGFAEMLVFIAILLVALIYLWRIGALDWRTARQKLQDRILRN